MNKYIFPVQQKIFRKSYITIGQFIHCLPTFQWSKLQLDIDTQSYIRILESLIHWFNLFSSIFKTLDNVDATQP